MKYTQKVAFEERAAATLYSPTTTLVCDGGGQSKLLIKEIEGVDTEMKIVGDSIDDLDVEKKGLDYLTFKCVEAGSIGMTHKGTNATTTKPSIQYSLNGSEWVDWDYTTIGLAVGDVVKMKGINPNGIGIGLRRSSNTSNYSQFTMTGKIAASGNIMSLIDGEKDGTKVIPGPFCYYYIFKDCTSLISAPDLPATTLNSHCYFGMFRDCTSLTTAPELPATTLDEYCYQSMFRDCTSLTTAPELPATTLIDGCYYYMLRGCTSLTSAPELLATTLTFRCYFYMFYGCTKLNYVKCLATNISAETCTDTWLSDVSSTGTFVKNTSTYWPTGVHGIPEGWTVVNA